jgi:predicted RNase H-like HicB family nuclease
MQYKVTVLIEKDEHGYYAYSPELKGCQTQGDSFEQVLSRMKEAIALYLEDLDEEQRSQYLTQEIITTTVEVTID